MLSFALSTGSVTHLLARNSFPFSNITQASTYFHLPIDEEEDADIEKYQRKYLTWTADSSPGLLAGTVPTPSIRNYEQRTAILKQIIDCNDLYEILGVTKTISLDRMMLRRAYLSRSKACHPDKFPDDPDATLAFQKVALAYDVLSKPSSRKLYDTKASSSNYDAFAHFPSGYAEDTLKGVVLAAFNDFLEGDLEMVRTLLKAIHDINPSLGLREEGISSIMEALRTIRKRALTCRTCVCALHAELTRLLEIKSAFQKLSYFDFMSRSRLIIQLARVTVTLPITLENALRDQESNIHSNIEGETEATLFPRQLIFLIRAVDLVLERMERILQ